jgi:hypothetical protein
MSKSAADAGDVKVVVADEEMAPLKAAAATVGVGSIAVAPAAIKPQQEMAVPMHARLSNAGKDTKLTRFEFGGGNPFSRLFLNCESKLVHVRSLSSATHSTQQPSAHKRLRAIATDACRPQGAPQTTVLRGQHAQATTFIVCSSPKFVRLPWLVRARIHHRILKQFIVCINAYSLDAADCAREPTEYSHSTIICIVCNPFIRTQL